MLTIRVLGSSAPIHVRAIPHDAELLIAYPPPGTPNFPATVGSARMAIDALPPLRLRSWPQPQRINAGLAFAYASAAARRAPASMAASCAARSNVQGRARSRGS